MFVRIRFACVFALILCVQSVSFAQKEDKLSLKIGFEGSYMKRNDNSNIASTALNQAKDTLFLKFSKQREKQRSIVED